MKKIIIGITPTIELYKEGSPYKDVYKFVTMYPNKIQNKFEYLGSHLNFSASKRS